MSTARVFADVLAAKGARSITLDKDSELDAWIAEIRHQVSLAHMLEEADKPAAARERFAKIAGIAFAAMQAIDGTLTGESTLEQSRPTTHCECRKCLEGVTVETGFGPIPVTMTRMIVCSKCGNKRCPHANDHRNACTGSNEPGQLGSAYA
jgi:hypothetical protein